MKNTRFIISTSKKQGFVYEFDLREIDNEDKYNSFYLRCMGRISEVIGVSERYYRKIFGAECAQGNISLLLAEKGGSP